MSRTSAKFSCALLSSGKVQCWGNNTLGELGHGTSTAYLSQRPNAIGPVELSANAKAISIAPSSSMACALLTTDEVQCWGHNALGALGIGSTDPVIASSSHIPDSTHDLGSASDDDIAASGLVGLGTNQKILDLSVGYNHTCAVIQDPQNGDELKCWGGNSNMERGYGTSAPTAGLTPVGYSAVSISPVASVSAGAGHTCAVLKSGDVKCWGGNTTGQLGLGYVNSHTGASLPSQLPALRILQ